MFLVRLFPLPKRSVGECLFAGAGKGRAGPPSKAPSWAGKGRARCPSVPHMGVASQMPVLGLLHLALGRASSFLLVGQLRPSALATRRHRRASPAASVSGPCLAQKGGQWYPHLRPDSQNVCSSHGSVYPLFRRSSLLAPAGRLGAGLRPCRVRVPLLPALPGLACSPVPQPG